MATIERALREFIHTERSSHGFFPCYGGFDLRGDPTFHAADVVRYATSPIQLARRVVMLCCAPFMLLRTVAPFRNEGHQVELKTQGRWTLRFHAFFTDSYFYDTILRTLHSVDLSADEKAAWVDILIDMVELPLACDVGMRVGREEFRLFKFFTPDDPRLRGEAVGSRGFFSSSGLLEGMEPDADTNCVLFEMFSNALPILEQAAALGIREERIRPVRARIEAVLAQPIWRLIHHYQFRPDGRPEAVVNYTDVESSGGVTTFFTPDPEDAPDLVVNVNVLRSFLVNARRWKLHDIPQALEVMRTIAGFLERNVMSGLFRSVRGYSFYTPLIFAAMYGRLWRVFCDLEPAERGALELDVKLDAIRLEVLAFLRAEFNSAGTTLNPLDAALALGAAVDLGETDRALLDPWVKLLHARFQSEPPHYRAYEVFRGKLPTFTVYGSEAITAAFVHYALVGYAAHARRHEERT
jgi:hypothetical protein